jgi:hypothetical protein
MPFKVLAFRDDEPTSATRLFPASAVVLAMNWEKKGLREVRIEDNAGRRYSLSSFQARTSRQNTTFTAF